MEIVHRWLFSFSFSLLHFFQKDMYSFAGMDHEELCHAFAKSFACVQLEVLAAAPSTCKVSFMKTLQRGL